MRLDLMGKLQIGIGHQASETEGFRPGKRYLPGDTMRGNRHPAMSSLGADPEPLCEEFFDA